MADFNIDRVLLARSMRHRCSTAALRQYEEQPALHGREMMGRGGDLERFGIAQQLLDSFHGAFVQVHDPGGPLAGKPH